MKFRILCFALLCSSKFYAQTPLLSSWLQNTTIMGNNQSNSGALTPNGICNVQSVYYDATWAYITSTDLPAYTVGPWAANPNVASTQAYKSKFPITPTVNNGTKTNTGLGAIGLWKNGVAVFNAKDGMYWNPMTSAIANGPGVGYWNRNAYYWEGISFDNCVGHAAQSGVYHLHASAKCLYDQNATTVHSPIIGWAWDGYPIYGAYAYTNTDGTGAIKRMVSSYILPTTLTRTANANGNGTTQTGPTNFTTYPIGSMAEDYYYSAGAGDLDQYNGRTCVTPEFPSGTYAYFVTINASSVPAYPFVLGPKYNGVAASTSTTAFTTSTIPAGAILYTAAPLPVELFDFSVQLKDKNAMGVWSVGVENNISHYEVERSINAVDFELIFTQNANKQATYRFKDGNLKQGNYYYRLKTVERDGKITYSSIVSVKVLEKNALLIHNNPATDLLIIQHTDAMNDRTVSIFDQNGRLVLSANMPQGFTLISLDIQTIYAGLYVIKIADGENILTSKLIITK